MSSACTAGWLAARPLWIDRLDCTSYLSQRQESPRIAFNLCSEVTRYPPDAQTTTDYGARRKGFWKILQPVSKQVRESTKRY